MSGDLKDRQVLDIDDGKAFQGKRTVLAALFKVASLCTNDIRNLRPHVKQYIASFIKRVLQWAIWRLQVEVEGQREKEEFGKVGCSQITEGCK